MTENSSGMSKVTYEVGRLAAAAELESLVLTEMSFERSEALPEPPYSIELAAAPSAKLGESRDLVYEVGYEIVGTGEDDVRVLDLRCKFQVAYDLKNDVEPGQDAIEAFGETTVLFTLHPYLRQLTHDITSRSGLPPLLLSLLKINPEVSGLLANSESTRKDISIAANVDDPDGSDSSNAKR